MYHDMNFVAAVSSRRRRVSWVYDSTCATAEIPDCFCNQAVTEVNFVVILNQMQTYGTKATLFWHVPG